MTPKEYSAKLDRRLKTFKNAAWFAGCAIEAHASMVDRIFQQGLNADSKPHDANRDYAVYSPGYERKREKKGRQIKFVDLIFEGRLLQDFATSLRKDGDSYVAGTKNSENSNKVDWLIDLYGDKTFKASEEERKEYTDCVRKKMIDILTK